MTLKHSAILSSTASGSGGGIYNAAMRIIQQSTLAGNSADEGGGILNNGGTLLIQQSTLTENTALYGGGILMISGTLTLENNTLSDNTATGTASTGGGGAIDLYNGAVGISNSTIGNLLIQSRYDFAKSLPFPSTIHRNTTTRRITHAKHATFA